MDVQVSNIKSIIIAIASLSGDPIEKVCEECGLDSTNQLFFSG